jgi:periplasmic protein TonB
MIAYQDTSMFSGRRGAALAAAAVLHMAAVCAFYFGLAQPIIQHFTPPPIHVDNIPKPREKVVVQDTAPKFDPWKLQFNPPVNPRIPADPASAVSAELNPTESTAGADSRADPTPVHEHVLATAARMDSKHPLHIGPDYYPAGAVRREQEGRCVVQVTVAVDGRITTSSLLASSGFPLLDDACLSAVRGQHMLPATQDGKAIDSTVSLPIVWKLSGSR